MLTLSTLRYRSEGFSLIELMVAISIMAIAVAIAMPSYTTYIQNTQIRNVAEAIQNGLQLARAEAVKRNGFVKFELGEESDWEVCLVSGDDNECVEEIQSRATGEGSSSKVSIVTDPEDVTIVTFNSLGGPNKAAKFVISVENAEGTRPLNVILGVGGNTRMCDPNSGLSDDDPRKCRGDEV